MLRNGCARFSGKAVTTGLLLAGVLIGLAVFLLIQSGSKTQTAKEQPEPPPRTTQRPAAAEVQALESTIPLPEPANTRPTRTEKQHRVALRSRTGPMKPSLAEIAARHIDGETAPIEIPTFDGASVHITIRNTDQRDDGRISVVTGTVVGEPGSLVSLAQSGSSPAGSILIPSKNLAYEIRPAPDGEMIFSEIDVHALGECQTCLEAAH